METLIPIITFLIFVLILISPILILKRLKKNILLNYSLISLLILGILLVVFAWWSDQSNLILLNHFGYNINGMNYDEFYGNVSPENMEKVKNLETSIMGIGWPLKAMFGYVIFMPYLIIVYFGKINIDRMKNKKTLPNTLQINCFGSGLFRKVLADFLFSYYLLTLVLNHRKKSCRTTLPFIVSKFGRNQLKLNKKVI